MSEKKSDINIFEQLKDGITDRISGALTGCFTVFLILWNWKAAIHLLYGDSSPNDRIASIESLYPEDALSAFGFFTVPPFILTAAYVILVPLLRDLYARKISEHFRQKAKKREILHELEMRQVADVGQTYKAILGHLCSDVGAAHNAILGASQEMNRVIERNGWVSGENIVKIRKTLESLVSSMNKVLHPYAPFFVERTGILADLVASAKKVEPEVQIKREPSALPP